MFLGTPLLVEALTLGLQMIRVVVGLFCLKTAL